MARQQSSTDLAGSLGATLTPRVAPASVESLRSDQNSGLFDMEALYAQARGQGMHRARSDARLLPLARAAQATWPRTVPWPQPVVSFSVETEVPIEFTETPGAPRARGLGWFGVAVAWLATVATGAVIATSLPAHAPTHSRAGASSTVAVVVPAAPQAASLAAAVPTPVPIAAPPIVALASLPLAPHTPSPVTAPAQPVSPVAPARPIVRQLVAPSVAHARPAPVASAAPPAPPATAVPRALVPTKSAPAAVSTAGMSLDELIRHEVQVESRKPR